MASTISTYDIIGSHLLKLWRDDILTDVAISHEGEVICQAHQVVMSAFSATLMQRLREASVMVMDDERRFKVPRFHFIRSWTFYCICLNGRCVKPLKGYFVSTKAHQLEITLKYRVSQ